MLIWQGKCPVSDASQSAPQSQSDAIHQPARKCGESGCTENRVPSGTAPKKGLHATTSFSDNNSQTSSLQLCPALCPPSAVTASRSRIECILPSRRNAVTRKQDGEMNLTGRCSVYPLVALATLLCRPVQVAGQAQPTQASAPWAPLTEAQIRDKARNLLQQMTLEEKVAQLSQLPGVDSAEFKENVKQPIEEVIKQVGAGSVLWIS